MEKILSALKQELKGLASHEGQAAARKFHKEEIKTYGIKMPVVRALAKQYFRDIKDRGKDEIFKMCDTLFSSGFVEDAHIACEWTFLLRRSFEKNDLKQFRYWIEHYINNWATCDNFCNNTVGAFLMMHPEYVTQLKKWAATKNRWLQRAAAVSLILPARDGLFLEESFDIADLLLTNEDDLVQKGYGWLLKVASKPYEKKVFDYVNKRKEEMPRTALRYAIEHFDEEKKKKLMGK